MRIDVITVFPDLVRQFAGHSLIGKAIERGLLDVRVHGLRDYADGMHRATDDAPYGGGAGMVMLPEPIMRCVEACEVPRPLFALGPAGTPLTQSIARSLAEGPGLTLLCGRYEGIDDRIVSNVCDGELSVGDVVLNGGEVAAMMVIEAVGRLIPGVMGNASSGEDESFSDGLLEYPQYTRPAEFRGWAVPDVLRSGDHARVERWRRAQSLARTRDRRPDLIEARGGLTEADLALLGEFDLG